MVKRGSFIVFEGIDGCGKSTQVDLLVDAISAAGHEALATFEPTNGTFGQQIRHKAHAGEDIDPEIELNWFEQDRHEHVENVLEPALKEGCVVVCDRYYLSTVAYQGARGLDWKELLASNLAAFPAPDLVLLMEMDTDQSQARLSQRSGPAEPTFENRSFQERVDTIFKAVQLPCIERIDGNGTPEEVHQRIREAVQQRLQLF
ncbi:MAG: dTMP kinase [Deltaproteobacteria bacterium]|nr:dTMP kinase [Deltaproteobacteria bacterium]